MSKGSYLVEALTAFTDNYIWLIKDLKNQAAWVVDPGDASPVLNTLNQQQLQLQGILITHHHYDHINGIPKLIEKLPKVRVIGPSHKQIPWVTDSALDYEPEKQNTLNIFDGLSLTSIPVPGHTLEHVAYFLEETRDDLINQEESSPMLFCGDTLFSSGCGRLFEGTPEMMWESLKKLRALPSNTAVYCAHEYTLSNLDFARFILPKNQAIKTRAKEATKLRASGLSTLPSTIHQERQVNPFLMADKLELKNAIQLQDNVVDKNEYQIFKTLRAMKDKF